MHETSHAKMAAFVRDYLADYMKTPLQILELGSRSVLHQKTYRSLFDSPTWTYSGADIESGENVDVVLTDSRSWDMIGSATCDVVISGQMLEHSENPWVFCREAHRVLKPGGLVCLIVPSSGDEHRFPVDCWRFYRDAMRAFGKESRLNVVEAFTDYGLGNWQDTFGIFQKPLDEAGAPSPFPPQTDREVAFRIYHAALRNRPRNQVYYRHLAALLKERGRNQEAEQAWRAALDVFPANVQCRVKLVELLMARGEYAAAAEHCLIMLGQGSVAPDAVHLYGAVYDKLPNATAELFTFALPVAAEKLRRLAQLSHNDGHFSFATICWNKLRSLEPCHVNPESMYCLALLGAGRRDEAMDGFASLRQAQLSRGEVNRTTVLQQLIDRLGAQRYLEIGVQMGVNFLQIEVPEKHGVDPAFQIPGGHEDASGMHFHPKSSDDFFASPPQILRESGVAVALVDGDHTYRQVLRDLENLLPLLNEGGVIVVHDCLPANEAEAMPSLAEAKRHGSFNTCWTGDGYKAIAHLRATRDDLFVAVLDCDHGLGLVQRGKPESTLDIALSDIDTLDFHALRYRTADILNLKRPEWFETFLNSLPH